MEESEFMKTENPSSVDNDRASAAKMWVEVICGLVIFRVLKHYLYDSSSDADDSLLLRRDDSFSTHPAVLFSVADRLQKLSGGKTYVGLHIPDPDSASRRRNIDIVNLTNREAVVISVVNLSGTVSVDRSDGSWICSPDSTSGHRKDHRIPDPIAEIKQQVAILESYLEQRGLPLPQGYLSYKLICPNPQFRMTDPYLLLPEVITHDQWVQQKPQTNGLMFLSGWMKGAFGGGNKETQNSLQPKLTSIIRTAPMWDRLELKGNKVVFGEFVEFKGKQDDIQALLKVRRSKVERLVIQKTSIFGIGGSKLQVVYCDRDYRGEGTSSSEWKEVMVRSKTEVVFEPKGCTKNHKYKLSSVVSMTLSA